MDSVGYALEDIPGYAHPKQDDGSVAFCVLVGLPVQPLPGLPHLARNFGIELAMECALIGLRVQDVLTIVVAGVLDLWPVQLPLLLEVLQVLSEGFTTPAPSTHPSYTKSYTHPLHSI